MSDALNPCPFCGCSELKIMGDDHQSFLGGYHVYCHNPNCQASGRHSGSREKAIAAWNRRPKLKCLDTERDDIRADSERYRWLRDSSDDTVCVVRIHYWSDEYRGQAGIEVIDGHHLDNDIDAARSKGED